MKSYIKLLRPSQWLKNLMLLFPPFLGGQIFQLGGLAAILVPIAAFCSASSATYIVNDILDRESDSLHPKKRERPVASGAIHVSMAVLLSLSLFALAIGLCLRLSMLFLVLMLGYCAISLAYSFFLKNVPIVDLFCISAGFLVRLQAGGEAYHVAVSEWLFLSVFFLAVFLSTGKRLGEKVALGNRAGSHRKSLLSYPDGFLDGIMYMTGGAVLVTYTMYVISRHSLIYCVPLCAFGLLRFMLVVKSGDLADPTEALVRDGALFVVGFCWAVMVGLGVYLP